ncbi:uncharacterized protein MELLADRAFT_114327 [Melampsora larici-populina 98AG31]|uniref:Uncharacterized protein n=1 Tax=Melampsora larici-populina (strain 98AG31 / pathotype 3-4-7) TaxID=747676 RepID=F4SD20_MELLP|nr:uncharacterized protein MELLADRAFT_114327 [Melampsora larici-populina 98AG31]EGF97454.1 hypothetical protein MELLADRAFT_114327 [Melampsora larici-populina 98AG31]
MAPSNFIAQSTKESNSINVTEHIKSSQEYTDKSSLHPVRFSKLDDQRNTSKISRSPDDHITEKLLALKIQRPAHSLQKPTRQRKVTVSPYHRKSPITPPRTPEISRKSFRMPRNPTVKLEKKESINGKATQHSIFRINDVSSYLYQ